MLELIGLNRSKLSMNNPFDWVVTALACDKDIFTGMKPSEVLYEFDGPRLFTARSQQGDLLYYLADQSGDVCRYIVAPTNANIVNQLKTGVRAVRDALNQPWVWFLDTEIGGSPVAAWLGTLADAPLDAVPAAGVMLWPHLAPVFAIRAIGAGLAEGAVPASVVRQVVDGATTALKKVAALVFQTTHAQGRKANAIRQFYDLPLHSIAYNSFEIAFRMPDGQQQLSGNVNNIDATTSEFDAIGKLLDKALAWAMVDGQNEADNIIDIDLLEAIEKIVPPQTGIIKAVELRGSIFPPGCANYHLTRNSTKRVRQALTTARATQERVIKVTGLVRQLDVDELVFTLRETDDQKEHVCQFAQASFDDVFEAFNTDKRLTVSGRESIKNGNIEVLLVAYESSSVS